MTPQQVVEALASPIAVGSLRLRNRMVMGPMAVTCPTPEGAASDQTVALFEARARGGIGMIIVGGIACTSLSQSDVPMTGLRFDQDRFIPGLRRVADAVHAHGVPILAELVPSLGRMARPPAGRRVISASPINVNAPEDRLPRNVCLPGGIVTVTPQEATIEEIELLEREVVQAAVRAKAAGWDGVEVAAHMSYFAASFLSPRTNWRSDRYGGSVENRARMLVNIVTGIRAGLGKEFVVGLRILSNDYLPDGPGPAGYAEVAQEVERAGIDYVALAPGCYETMDMSMTGVDGLMVDSGEGRVFKQALSVPVFLQGLHDPRRGAAALAEGHGDVVMLARQTLADPEYAKKVSEGRLDDIVRCNRDNECLRRLMFNLPIRCSVNPQLGLESRQRGEWSLVERFVQLPKEQAILRLTGQRWFMKAATMVMKQRAPAVAKER